VPDRNARVMPQYQFRVFLSAVTSEFGKARVALGADLRSRDTLLRVQSDFRQEPGSDTTLKKLPLSAGARESGPIHTGDEAPVSKL
jgi:hypothetical protein